MESNIEIKVSVIMPIYNASEYLKPALDSVLEQTLSDIEVICIDDGSTDSSLEILKEYQERDSRVRIVTETNAGPALARNNGIRRARGEYIAFLDADDFVEPRFLEELYGLAKRDDLDIAICKYDLYNSRTAKFEPANRADHSDIFKPGEVTSKGEHPNTILTSTVGSAWNKLFRRSFVADKGLSFLEEVRMFEDVYFVAAAMSLAERIGKCFEVLVHHRIHSEQSRAKLFKKYYLHVPLMYQRIKEFLVSHGLYAPLSVSFLNLSASRCYKIFNLLPREEKEKYWNTVNDKYAEPLGWGGHDPADFESEEVCEFVINVQSFDFSEYERRSQRGAKVELERMNQTITMAKNRKKVRGFFSRIFKKNKNSNSTKE
jgi:glycosyltransferase involved in cell wall biosynthesis